MFCVRGKYFYVLFDKSGLNSYEDTFYQTISVKSNGKSELVYNFDSCHTIFIQQGPCVTIKTSVKLCQHL